MCNLLTAFIILVSVVIAAGEEDSLATPAMKQHTPGAVELGWKYFQRGDFNTALRRFKMAVRHDKEFAPGYYGVAYIHSVRGDLDKAIKNYRETLKRDPKHVYANANIGYALLQRNQDQEALKYLEAALALNPDCGEAHVSYMFYHAKHEEWENAGKSANRAVELKQSIPPDFRQFLGGHGVKIKPNETEMATPRKASD